MSILIGMSGFGLGGLVGYWQNAKANVPKTSIIAKVVFVTSSMSSLDTGSLSSLLVTNRYLLRILSFEGCGDGTVS